MAGFNVGGLPAFIQYQGQLQQQEQAKQEQQMRLQAWQQSQQDRQRQQAAMAAAGNALPQLMGGGMPAQQPQGQMPPPPQPPAPGQASQPMQQPGMPMPGQGVPPGQGQVNQPPLPPGGAQGQPQQPPPFRPMPTSPPPQQAAPQGIPAPPQQPQAPQQAPQQQGPGGPLTMQSAIKVLQDQGLSGADLMAGLQQLTPLLDSQAKQQSAQLQQQFNNELKLQDLNVKKDSLQARIDAAKQASEDRKLGIREREQAHRDSLGMQQQLLQFRIDEAKARHASNPDAKLDKDTIEILAEQAHAGDPTVYQNLGRGVQGAQNIVAIRKRVAELDRAAGETGADQAARNVAFQGEKAAARSTAVASGKQSQAADEATQLADKALAVSSTIDNGRYTDVNSWVNDLTKRGATDKKAQDQLARFNVAVQGFRNTYSRAITPTGAPTVHDKQHADDLFSTNQSPSAFAASMDQAKQEMAAAISAPAHVQERQRARIAGRAAPEAGGQTQTINGKTYVQRDGKWFEQ